MIIDKFLWCHTPEHDKYWGWKKIDKTYYNFWGKRGNKKIIFKRYIITQHNIATTSYVKGQYYVTVGTNIPNKLAKLYDEKINKKGYKDFTDKIERFFPGFLKEFELQLTIAKLADNFHNEKA